MRDRASDDAEPGWIRLYLLPAIGVAALVALAVWTLDLAPPQRATLAAGRPGSAYYHLAERYRDILARDGIALEIVETPGSVANAEALLRADDPADAAFLQGGVALPADAPVEALAAVFLEPLWIFHGGRLRDPADPSRWRGLSIAAGEPGSGTRFAVEAALNALGLDSGALSLLPMSSTDAAEALAAREIDAAIFVAPVTAPYLQPLFADDGIEVAPIRDAEALARRLPFIEITDLPPSSIDYAERRPRERIELVAMVGRLVAREGLHPALVDRLVEAAREVHSERDLITTEGQFPSVAGVAMAVNSQAATLIGNGPSALNRFLPYWVGAQIDRFALLLLPLAVILIPIFRIAPGLYQWRMRSRVWKYYGELREIDDGAVATRDPQALAGLDERLHAIERELVQVNLPPRFREYAYALRLHLNVVRQRIAARRAEIG